MGAIPSKDPNWKSIVPLDHNNWIPGIKQLDKATQQGLTTHGTLARLKKVAEGNDLPKWRRQFGLKPKVITWKALLEQNIPCVIPIQPGTFPRPADWPSRVFLADFI